LRKINKIPIAWYNRERLEGTLVAWLPYGYEIWAVAAKGNCKAAQIAEISFILLWKVNRTFDLKK
jgi:hypothetical protein